MIIFIFLMLQYIDLEEEFEKWKIKTENDISQKNLEIGDLREKLRLTEQPVTNDFWVQVPDEISLPTLPDLSHCKSSSASSIPSINEPNMNIDLCDTNDQTSELSYHTSEFLSNPNTLLKQEVQADDYNLYDIHDECSTKGMDIHKEQKFQIDKKDPYIDVKVMKEKDKYEFTWMQDMLMQNLKKVGCHCAQNTQQRVCCIELSVLQNLNMKLYAQERKKRQLQHYFKRQQQHVEKILQRKSPFHFVTSLM